MTNIIIILLFSSSALLANEQLPGSDQKRPILLRGGTLHTVSGDVLEGYDMLFAEGKIITIDEQIQASPETDILEIYENNKLVFFKSNTIQNKKKKFVNLKYDKNLNKFIIDGSSFKGKADIDNVIGNWWNNKILTANRQISPLSGSIKEQTVNLLKKEMIKLYGKSYEVLHYKLKSKNANLPKDKKLNFDIWLDPQKSLIVKIAYERMGKWEYRLKNFE